MQNIILTRKVVEDENIVLHLSWNAQIELSQWTEAHTVQWRKYAAIIPQAHKKAQQFMRRNGIASSMIAAPDWFLPEEDMDGPPRVTAFFKVAADDEHQALSEIKRALVDTIEQYETPYVPRPDPLSVTDSDDADDLAPE
ncbi:hypothetical protein AB0O58_07040 [Rhodococcus sp. NPDC080181]|uniref:hypothetical protein n=1 Tax=Rhodococcus sp. NPDC080181 TaxID=3155292 RepID=UPI00344DFE82